MTPHAMNFEQLNVQNKTHCVLYHIINKQSYRYD
jgi:hypothetical protein